MTVVCGKLNHRCILSQIQKSFIQLLPLCETHLLYIVSVCSEVTHCIERDHGKWSRCDMEKIGSSHYLKLGVYLLKVLGLQWKQLLLNYMHSQTSTFTCIHRLWACLWASESIKKHTNSTIEHVFKRGFYWNTNEETQTQLKWKLWSAQKQSYVKYVM